MRGGKQSPAPNRKTHIMFIYNDTKELIDALKTAYKDGEDVTQHLHTVDGSNGAVLCFVAKKYLMLHAVQLLDGGQILILSGKHARGYAPASTYKNTPSQLNEMLNNALALIEVSDA